ncbi:hypothetical protein RUM43_003204 [Polyplax serrata]|uniref:LIM zinc-binding domain-containing protein n=1 Tax=Polyplax serrata TaxID=468196 RepID=A0AAN8PF20_POLSC
MFVMKRCARCQAAISSSELVMRARDFVFHVHCFTCTVCNTTLTKGDHFGLRNGAIFCRSHYDLCEPSEAEAQTVFSHYPSSFPSPEFPNSHTSPIPLPPPGPSPTENVLSSKVPFFNGSSPAAPRQKGRPRKRKPKDLEAMTANLGE